MSQLRLTFARQIGATYVEVLIATVLVAVSLIPMMNAVSGATKSSDVHQETAVRHLHLVAKLEDVLAEPFSVLEDAAIAAGGRTIVSSYSDAGGSTNRRLVFLSLYDGDNADADDDPFTGVDPGLMWIRTEIENSPLAVESLKSR